MTAPAISMLIGYLIGGINPAAFLAALKKKDLRSSGTKNLGAANVTLTLGKRYGTVVMVFDVFKGFFSVRLARFLFPMAGMAGLLAGCGAVIGHIYPVYLRFRGGKGLAAFGGMILALDTRLFLLLLTIGIVVAFVTDYVVALTLSAVSLAPFMVGFRAQSTAAFGVILFISGLILYKHRENIVWIREGTEVRLRDFLKKHFSR